MEGLNVANFATRQLELLEAEFKAELAATSDLLTQSSPAALQRTGNAILNLSIAHQHTGLGGKTVLNLELDSAIGSDDRSLPEFVGLRTGDIVCVQEQPKGNERKKELGELKKAGVNGVVVRFTSFRIQVALDHDSDRVPEGRLWVFKLANDVTHKRLKQVMTRLRDMPEAEHTMFMRVMFGKSTPSISSIESKGAEPGITFFDDSLNQAQKDAVQFALESEEVALIHGPPGTGKTHTIIELIRQLLKLDKRVLVCGPSNLSVDNIVDRLVPHKIPMMRLGHPARILPSVLAHSQDYLTQQSDAAAIIRDIRAEMDEKQKTIGKTKSKRDRKVIYGELKELRKDFRERENRCVNQLVQSRKVVLATLHGAGGRQLRNEKFDVVIIDEASQALEAQCWIPLISARKVVLAGDHLQLPPTVKSDLGKSTGKKNSKISETLEFTLFDRLLKTYGPSIKRMLTVQYRMHEKIMRFPSDELYDSELVAAESIAGRLLKDLEYGVRNEDDTNEPIVFWDTQGGDYPEQTEEMTSKLVSDSKCNPGEVTIIAKHIKSLVDNGVTPDHIAVITPYNAQVALLAREIKEIGPRFGEVEFGTVDGFQGREQEAVIVSLVRSNEKREVGFLAEKRRLNVAMTRAIRHLCVVGDSETVGSGSPYLKRWMEFLEANADLRYPS